MVIFLKVFFSLLILKTTSMIFFSATILFCLLKLLNFSTISKAKWGILVDFSSGSGCLIDSAHLENSYFLSAIDFLRVAFLRDGSFSTIEIEHSRSFLVEPNAISDFRWGHKSRKNWSWSKNIHLLMYCSLTASPLLVFDYYAIYVLSWALSVFILDLAFTDVFLKYSTNSVQTFSFCFLFS